MGSHSALLKVEVMSDASFKSEDLALSAENFSNIVFNCLYFLTCSSMVQHASIDRALRKGWKEEKTIILKILNSYTYEDFVCSTL